MFSTETTHEPTVTQGTAAAKQKNITPATASGALSKVLMAAPTDNASAEKHDTLQDGRVEVGDPLFTAGDSEHSDQIYVMQDSDGETASSQHAAAVTRLFGDPITLSELEKFLLYAEN